MRIKVFPPTSENTIIITNVDDSTTVAELKIALGEHLLLRPDLILLLQKSNKIFLKNDKKTLKHYMINNDSELHILMKLSRITSINSKNGYSSDGSIG
jgi:hypothetical protein